MGSGTKETKIIDSKDELVARKADLVLRRLTVRYANGTPESRYYLVWPDGTKEWGGKVRLRKKLDEHKQTGFDFG